MTTTLTTVAHSTDVLTKVLTLTGFTPSSLIPDLQPLVKGTPGQPGSKVTERWGYPGIKTTDASLRFDNGLVSLKSLPMPDGSVSFGYRRDFSMLDTRLVTAVNSVTGQVETGPMETRVSLKVPLAGDFTAPDASIVLAMLSNLMLQYANTVASDTGLPAIVVMGKILRGYGLGL